MVKRIETQKAPVSPVAIQSGPDLVRHGHHLAPAIGPDVYLVDGLSHA